MIQSLNNNNVSNDILTIWELEYESGEPKPDGKEIVEVAFFPIDELMNNPNIGGWTKEIVSATMNNKGLTNSKYSPQSHPNGTIYWKTYLT